MGEACFVRGFVDYELAMYWGEIPIIDLDKLDETGYGRQPLTDVWQFIINDLEKAAKYAPKTNTAGRFASGAGYTMLGKSLYVRPG